MLNIFKKNEKVTEVPLDLKQEEQRLLQQLEEVRERMKFESVQSRNTDHIEQTFKDAGYEFSLSPHPAMWDMNFGEDNSNRKMGGYVESLDNLSHNIDMYGDIA